MTFISRQLWITQSGTEMEGKFKKQKEVRRNLTFYLILTVAGLNSALYQGSHQRQADGDAAVGRGRWQACLDGQGIVDQSCKETAVTKKIQQRYNQHIPSG